MTFQSITPLPNASISNDNGKRSMPQSYHAKSDIINETALACETYVKTALDVDIGDKFGTSTLRLSSISCEQQENNPDIWLVVLTYSTPDGSSDAPEPGESSYTEADFRFNYRMGSVEREIVVRSDLDNLKLTNSLLVPYDPPITRTVIDPIFYIEGFCTSTFLASIYSNTGQMGVVNSDAWNGFLATQCLLKWDGIEYLWDYDVWKATAVIEVNRYGWRRKIADMGFEVITGSTYYTSAYNPKKHIVDAVGQPISEPQFLNGEGELLGATDNPVAYPSGGYRLYPEVAFSTFGLTWKGASASGWSSIPSMME